MAPTDPALLDAAVTVARAAGELTLRWFRSADLAVDRKGDGTPVTEADRAAERLAREEISRRYPDDAILGEEEDARAGTSGRTWILDPIDGTKAFTRGVPLYSTLVAVEDAEGPAIGVIHLPALGETVWAGRGLGCFTATRPSDADRGTRPAPRYGEARPARVSTAGDLDGSYVSSSSFGHWGTGTLGRFLAAGANLRTWGDGYGYALVATGRVEVMVDPSAAHWDLAPMPVILTEAGGRFSALDGTPGARSGSGVASNGRLHDAALALMAG